MRCLPPILAGPAFALLAAHLHRAGPLAVASLVVRNARLGVRYDLGG